MPGTYLLGTKFSHSLHMRTRAQSTTMYMNATEYHSLHAVKYSRVKYNCSQAQWSKVEWNEGTSKKTCTAWHGMVWSVGGIESAAVFPTVTGCLVGSRYWDRTESLWNGKYPGYTVYQSVRYRYWGRTKLTQVSGTGTEVTNLPNCRVPVSSSYRTLPERSVGHGGRTEPYWGPRQGIHRANTPGKVWYGLKHSIPYPTPLYI